MVNSKTTYTQTTKNESAGSIYIFVNILYTHIYTHALYKYAYIYIDMGNKEKEAINFGKALGGGIRRRLPGKGQREKR